jgi:Protein of unknown function (DUF3500)
MLQFKNAGLLSIVLLISVLSAFRPPETSPVAEFLNSLNRDQKSKAMFAFDDQSKTRWHYFPASMWPRAGIRLHELNDRQKNLLFTLLRSFLSQTGYDKTREIMGLEEVLSALSGNSTMDDPENYYAAFYGNPETDSLWAWSFEGHHISLNFTVLNGKISIAPRFLGAHPATVTQGEHKGERPLGREEDLGFELINSLSAAQKQKALFRLQAFYDIVTSNSPEVKPLPTEGIKMEDLNRTQQATLLSLIDEYLSTMPKELAKKRMENLKKEELDEIRFGWAGGTEPGEPHYYRIQGKTFLVEFDNTQDHANHIHSVWRDFDGDFGRDLIHEHYMHDHNH